MYALETFVKNNVKVMTIREYRSKKAAMLKRRRGGANQTIIETAATKTPLMFKVLEILEMPYTDRVSEFGRFKLKL